MAQQQLARRIATPAPEVPVPTPTELGPPMEANVQGAVPTQAPAALAPAAPLPTSFAPGVPGGITPPAAPGAARRTMADVRAESAAPPPTSPVPLQHPSETWGTGEKVLGTLFPDYRRGAEERQQYEIGLHDADQRWRSNESTIELQQLTADGQRLTNYQREALQDIQDEEAFGARAAKALRAAQLGNYTDMLGLLNHNDDFRAMLQIPEGETVELAQGAQGQPTLMRRDSKGGVVQNSAITLADKQFDDLIDYWDPTAADGLKRSQAARLEIGTAPLRTDVERAQLGVLGTQAQVGQAAASAAVRRLPQTIAAGDIAAATDLTRAQIGGVQAAGEFGAIPTTEATRRATERAALTTAEGAAALAPGAQGMAATQQRMTAIGQVNTALKLGNTAEAANAFNLSGLADVLSGQATALRPEIKNKRETGFLIAYGADGKPLTYKGADGKPTDRVAKYNTALLDAAANPSKWKSSAWGLYDESTGNYLVLDPDWEKTLGGRGGKMSSIEFQNMKHANGLIAASYGGKFDDLSGKYSFGQGNELPARTAMSLAAELILDRNWDATRAHNVAIEYSNKGKGNYKASLRLLRDFLGESKPKPGAATRTAGTTGELIDRFPVPTGSPTPAPEVAPAAPPAAPAADQVGAVEPTPEQNAMGIWSWIARTAGLPLSYFNVPSMLGPEAEYTGTLTAEALRPQPAVANNQSRRTVPVQ